MHVRTQARSLSPEDLRTHLETVAQARQKNRAVTIGHMGGRLVIRVMARWNIFARAWHWMRGKKAKRQYRMEVLETLKDTGSGLALKKELLKGITSNNVPCFTRAEVARVRANKASFFRRARISGIDLESKLSTTTPAPQPQQGAAYFVETEHDKQRVMDYYRSLGDKGEVALIRKPNDFDKDDLARTIVSEDGQALENGIGRIFSDEPLSLVLDFTVMTPAQIASLNELFDQPPRFQGRQLGPGVSLICLVNKGMLTASADNPGPDFWRRMDKAGVQTSLPDLETRIRTDQTLINEVSSQPTTPEEGNVDEWSSALEYTSDNLSLDFYQQTGHWHSLLFGGLQLSSSGQLHFQDGLLSKLEGRFAILELHNAPTDNPEFTHELATAIREGGFWANGQWVPIPTEVQIVFKESGSEIINQQLSQFEPVKFEPGQPAPAFVCINEDTFESALANVTLKDQQLLEHNTLAELVQDAGNIMVSGRLLRSQWVQLLNQLSRLTPRPNLCIDARCPVPKGLDLEQFKVDPPASRHVQLTASDQTDSGQEVFVYDITPKTQPETLLSTIPMTSQKVMTFGQRYTPLMQALLKGTPVQLHGLETNPAVARLLESLLAPEPYVFLTGRKIPVPEPKLSCVTAPHKKPAGLWQSLPVTGQAREVAIQQDLERKLTPESRTKLSQLHSALKQLPRSTNKLYPNSPQSLDTPAILNKIGRQVIRETITDACSESAPYHWRKALNDVIAKEYRGDPNAYGFVKAQIHRCFPDSGELRVDRDAIRQWLKEHPGADRETVRDHFWELARHLTPACLPGLAQFSPIPDQNIDALLPIVTSCARTEQQPQLERQLQSSTQPPDRLRQLHGRHYRTAYNALMAAGQEGRLYKEDSVHNQALMLSRQLATQPEPLSTETAAAISRQWFTPELLNGDFKDLPEALVSGKTSHIRQLRRVRRLADKVGSSALIMLKGEAGTGKTYTAYAVAAQMADGQEPLVLSLSPEHTQEDLFGREVIKPRTVTINKSQLPYSEHPGALWQTLCKVTGYPGRSSHIEITFDRKTRQFLQEKLPEGEYYRILEDFEDNATEFEPGPLMKWAQSPNPPILILDEANLARQGVLHPLLGLRQVPPRITIHGRTIQLTSQHRVIMTGNPESYDGRIVDPEFRQHSLTLYYRPMGQETLQESVLTPGLPQEWPQSLTEHATKTCMQLYNQFHRVLPEHTFGPRDLKDILARIRLYTGNQVPDFATVNAVVWQAVCDSLAGEAGGKETPELRAVKHWYQAHFPCNNDCLEERQQAFTQFYNDMKRQLADDSFDFNMPSVKDLAFKIWLDLEKTGGKQAVIIEGEAGRGKDALLDRLLPYWLHSKRKPATFDRINASPENWDETKELASKAMRNGTVLVISELNTLPSRYLEGFFNEVLNGEAAEGFQLIATINPASYSGREAFSEAMQSRCTSVKIPSFTEAELTGMLTRRYPGQANFTQWLATRHCQLADRLEAAGSSVKLPLIKLMTVAETMKNLPASEWQAAFDQQYHLATMALEVQQTQATDASVNLPNPEQREREQRLSRVVNHQSQMPVVVKLGSAGTEATYHAPSCTLTLPDNPDFQALLDAAITTLKSDSPEPVVSDQAHEKMQQALDIVEQQEQEEKLVEAELPEEEARTGKAPSAWTLKFMPLHMIGRLFSHIPVTTLLKPVLKLPLDKLIGLVEYIPWNAIVAMINKLPLARLVDFFSGLPLERLASFVPELTEDRLQQLANNLPVERLATAFENLDLERLAGLASQVDAGRFKAMTDNLETDSWCAAMGMLENSKLGEMIEQFPVSSERRAELEQLFRDTGEDEDSASDARPETRKETKEAIKKEETKAPEVKPEERVKPPQTKKAAIQPFDPRPWRKLFGGKGTPDSSTIRQAQAKLPLEHIRHLPEFLTDYQIIQFCSGCPLDRATELCLSLPDERWSAISKNIGQKKMTDIISQLPEDRLKPMLQQLPLEVLENTRALLPADNPGFATVAALHKERSMLPAQAIPAPSQPESWPYLARKTDLKGKDETLDVFVANIDAKTETAQVLMGILKQFSLPTGVLKPMPAAESQLFFQKLAGLATTAINRESVENEILHFIGAYHEYAKTWVQSQIVLDKLPPYFSENVWRFLDGFRTMHQQGALSTRAYQELIGLLVLNKPALPEELSIEFLDDLRGHPVHGPKVAAIRDKYYQETLTAPMVLSDEVTRPDHFTRKPLPPEAAKFRIDFLERTLGKRVINQEWSNAPTGSAPDVNRLARREAAFPVKGAASEMPVVVVTAQRHELEQFVLEQLRQNPPFNLHSAERSAKNLQETERDMAQLVIRSFVESLKGHQQKAVWKVVNPSLLRHDHNWSRSIQPGTYGLEALPYMMSQYYHAARFQQPGDLTDYIPKLDTPLMLEAQNEPNAIILDKGQMQECLKEYMGQMSPGYFYDYLFPPRGP